MFLFAAMLLAIAAFLDGLSTVYMLRRGGWERNPIFGHYPSKSKIFGFGGAIIFAELAILFCLTSFISRYFLLLGVVQSAFHLFFALRNYRNFRSYPVVR